MASRQTSNMAVRLTATTLSQSSGGISSTGSVSPAMPALLISTSSPPSAATASGTMRSISARCPMSQRAAIRPGISLRDLAQRLLVDVADEHLGAVGRESAREFAADAGRAGGDQNFLQACPPRALSWPGLLRAVMRGLDPRIHDEQPRIPALRPNV